MPTQLHITATLEITPLLDISHEEIATTYHEGISEGMRHHIEPISLTSLLSCLRYAIASHIFDGHHPESARAFVGFHLGRVHGAVLTACGTRRPDVTTLALLEGKNALRGYRAGRHWFFEEAEPHERRLTDDHVIERFHELACEAPKWHGDPEGTWQFVLACLIGELSGQLFPITPKERTRWEQERQDALAWLAKQEVQAARRDSEPLPPLPVVEYTV